MELSYRSLYKNRDILLPAQLIRKTKLLRRPDHVMILLPAVRYAAVLESRPQRTLDIFQEAVLRCLRTGEASLRVISESLVLHIDLVRRIARDMEELGMTKNGRVTERGEDALRGISEERVFSRCNLYYDSLRGCLWDAVCEGGELSVVNPSSDTAGTNRSRYEYLTFGTVGKPINIQAYYVHLPDSAGKSWRVPEGAMFTAEEKLEAVKKGFRRRTRFRWDWESEEDPDTAETRAVEIVSGGIPCYIGTMLHPERDGWTVYHPFDGGECGALRQTLDELKDRQGYEDLKKNIHNIWDVSESEGLDISYGSNGEKARALFLRAPEDARLLELLSEALISWRNLKNISGAGAERHKSNLKTYVARCYEGVERILKTAADAAQEEISAACPAYDLTGFLTSETSINSEILAERARAVGFLEAPGRPFRCFFSYVPVTYMLGMGRQEMTVLLARNLLLMQDTNRHPFRTLLREGHTDFLDRVIRLKPLRDNAMHAYDLPFTFAEVEDFFPALLRWLSCFYPGVRLDQNALSTMAEAEEPETRGPKPLTSPEQRLDEAVGTVLNRFPDIRDQAVNVENLLRANSPDVFQAVCSVYEGCCARYVERFMVPADREALRRECIREHLDFCFQNLAKRGFSTQSDRLARWADSVNLNKAKKAAKTDIRKANPSIKLFFALYTAACSKGPEPERVAAERPMLIEQAAEAIRLRGHSSADAAPDEELRRRVVEDLYQNLRTVLNVFSASV